MPTKKVSTPDVQYSPWLTLDHFDLDWEDDNQAQWVCYEDLREWFNLPSLKRCRKSQIRLRVSDTSLGDDYQVVSNRMGFNTFMSARGQESVFTWGALDDLLYVGCWVGLEIRERK